MFSPCILGLFNMHITALMGFFGLQIDPQLLEFLGNAF